MSAKRSNWIEESPNPLRADRLAAGRAAYFEPLVQLASADTSLNAIPLDRRIVIYNAALGIEVKDVEVSIKTVSNLAEQMEGYIQKVTTDSIVIRVPAAQFDDAIRPIEALGTVTHRDVEGTDVTEEYIDLEARLRQAKTVHARLEALLAKADAVKDALAIEKELARVGGEVERLQAKLEYLKNRVAFATISVRFKRAARSPAQFKPLLQVPFHWVRQLDLEDLLGDNVVRRRED
jgi:hypothetical protein